MDVVAALVVQVVAALIPFLPHLLNVGQKEAEDRAGDLDSGGWDLAKRLWEPLRPKVEERPAAREAATDVVADPRNADATAALRNQLRKLLNEDPVLVRELAQLMEQSKQRGPARVEASGDRAVAIGGSAERAQIVTGDHNQFERTELRDIVGSQGVALANSTATVTGVNQGGTQVDPRVLMSALMDLQSALGQTTLPPQVRLVTQTAAGNAALEGVKGDEVQRDRVAENVQRVGEALKQANVAIQEGTSLWQSVQKVASVLGPLVGGARVVAAWFGIPLPV